MISYSTSRCRNTAIQPGERLVFQRFLFVLSCSAYRVATTVDYFPIWKNMRSPENWKSLWLLCTHYTITTWHYTTHKTYALQLFKNTCVSSRISKSAPDRPRYGRHSGTRTAARWKQPDDTNVRKIFWNILITQGLRVNWMYNNVS